MGHKTRERIALTGPRRPGDRGVRLAWARDRDGQKVRASRLASKDRHLRAPFSCLGCGEELVPHLGRIRSPHFAHRPGSNCPFTAPETALHQDAKQRILSLCEDALAGRRRVRVLSRCPTCRRPDPLDLGAAGDAAFAEAKVGSLRADVLLCRERRPVLAFEVRVTHAVEKEKETLLLSAGVRAVEVDAREEWEREDDGGADIVCARSFGFEPCAACRVAARAERELEKGGEAAEIAELEAYRARGLLPCRKEKAGSDPDDPFSPAERQNLSRRFLCPECGGKGLDLGVRIARHECPVGTGFAVARPVAWRGYDGSLVTLRSLGEPLPGPP
ncbi:MAG TPA: competence protein CoiA family protein [Anaeromyxobacter sp.]|nr:competence protein CoiA family protein [Anaeromyxobacter sp.]